MTPPTSRRWLVAAGLLLAAFAALTLWVKFHGTIPGDERALRWASAHAGASEEVSGLYQLFGGLGSPYSAVLVTLTTAVVVLRNVGAAEAGVVLAGSAVAVLERPVAALVGYTDAAVSMSVPADGYPSGHVLFATGAFGDIGWLGARHGRPEVTAIGVVVGVLMGTTRVAEGAHLFDEVLASYLLGGAWLCLLVGIALRANPARRAR